MRGTEPRLDEALRALLARWAADAQAQLLVLFGSAAGSAGRVPRDVDLALAFAQLPLPERRLSIIRELQDLAGARRADVAFLHRDTDPVRRALRARLRESAEAS